MLLDYPKGRTNSNSNSLANRERYQHQIKLLYCSMTLLVIIGILKPDIDGFGPFHVSIGVKGKI